MSVNPLYNSPLSQNWGLNFPQESRTDSQNDKADSSTAQKIKELTGNAPKATNKNPYASDISQLSSAVSSALKSMGLSSSDRVTFSTLMDHKADLETKFSENVRADLLKLGIDPSVDFRLVSGTDGTGVKVVSNHPDKAKIEKYFADNKNRVAEFEQIQGLANIENTRKSQSIDKDSLRSRLQLESMSAWFSDSPASSIMDFQPDYSNFYTGLNKVV